MKIKVWVAMALGLHAVSGFAAQTIQCTDQKDRANPTQVVFSATVISVNNLGDIVCNSGPAEIDWNGTPLKEVSSTPVPKARKYKDSEYLHFRFGAKSSGEIEHTFYDLVLPLGYENNSEFEGHLLGNTDQSGGAQHLNCILQ